MNNNDLRSVQEANYGVVERWWAIEVAKVKAHWYCLTHNWSYRIAIHRHYYETTLDYRCKIVAVTVMRGKATVKTFYEDSRHVDTV